MSQENSGLIHAYILDGKGAGQKVDWGQVRAWTPAEGPLWVHLDFTRPESEAWLKNESQLDEIAIDSLLATEPRPRCATLENGLLINLRGVNTNPGSEPEDMVSIRIYCDSGRIISTRKRRLLSESDISGALDKGVGPKTIGGVVASLAHRLTERMSTVVSDLDDAIDALEEEIITNTNRSPRSRLVALRREVIMLRRYLAPQRDALTRLLAEPASWLSGSNRLEIREANDRLSRYIEDLDSCRDRAAVAYEELSSRLSEEMNARMYVLSIVAALFLPLGFITGLFGINVGGIPLADSPLGFLEISLFLTALVIIQIIIFKAKKWF